MNLGNLENEVTWIKGLALTDTQKFSVSGGYASRILKLLLLFLKVRMNIKETFSQCLAHGRLNKIWVPFPLVRIVFFFLFIRKIKQVKAIYTSKASNSKLTFLSSIHPTWKWRHYWNKPEGSVSRENFSLSMKSPRTHFIPLSWSGLSSGTLSRTESKWSSCLGYTGTQVILLLRLELYVVFL